MAILINLQRLFARDTTGPLPEPETMPDANETTQTIDNVVGIDAAKIGGPVGTTNTNGDPSGRPSGRSGRVRTRLLPEGEEDKPYSPGEGSDHNGGGQVRRPVGWLVIIDGPGTGDWFALESGLTHLGRGADQNVCIDFGDQTISRQSHAFITYDIAHHRLQLSHGESRNRTRLNGVVVDGKVALTHGDSISIGKTTLRIAVFCDDQFSWPPIIDKGGSK
ncbi:FHA domain-containing protein [Boseongicola aestuarii]|uniref:FHA domain protein n=1 Tax=Boseongicola aestuarii TaxID=1470561 RepID=A0A238J044_9RHOB|nr:FHA domain-containing protein [Boseongicola aestuarii]SMX23997.1 FHA domain protein [Boseongicola aestuarii]